MTDLPSFGLLSASSPGSDMVLFSEPDMPYQATTAIPSTPAKALKTRATIPLVVKLHTTRIG